MTANIRRCRRRRQYPPTEDGLFSEALGISLWLATVLKSDQHRMFLCLSVFSWGWLWRLTRESSRLRLSDPGLFLVPPGRPPTAVAHLRVPDSRISSSALERFLSAKRANSSALKNASPLILVTPCLYIVARALHGVERGVAQCPFCSEKRQWSPRLSARTRDWIYLPIPMNGAPSGRCYNKNIWTIDSKQIFPESCCRLYLLIDKITV